MTVRWRDRVGVWLGNQSVPSFAGEALQCNKLRLPLGNETRSGDWHAGDWHAGESVSLHRNFRKSDLACFVADCRSWRVEGHQPCHFQIVDSNDSVVSSDNQPLLWIVDYNGIDTATLGVNLQRGAPTVAFDRRAPKPNGALPRFPPRPNVHRRKHRRN